MPTRIVREGINDSRAVNQLDDSAEILYRRLMSVVDDYGRYEADFELIQQKCFWRKLNEWPLSRVSQALADVSHVLTDDGHPLVTIYQVGTKKYLQINNFGQRIRSRSRFPSPDDGHMTVICPTDDGHPRTRKNVVLRVEANANANANSGRDGQNSPIPYDGSDSETQTAVSEFAEDSALDWFKANFRGEIEANLWQDWPLLVNTPEKLEALRKNLPLWMASPKYRSGYGKSAIWFLRDGIYLKPPPKTDSRDPPEEYKGPNPALVW